MRENAGVTIPVDREAPMKCPKNHWPNTGRNSGRGAQIIEYTDSPIRAARLSPSAISLDRILDAEFRRTPRIGGRCIITATEVRSFLLNRNRFRVRQAKPEHCYRYVHSGVF